MELILGSVVSLIVQYIKTKYPSNAAMTMALVLALSVATAGLFHLIVGLGMWEGVKDILITAGAFYAFVLRQFEK